MKDCYSTANVLARQFQLGKEALEENGDWVLLHRKKTLELPKN